MNKKKNAKEHQGPQKNTKGGVGTFEAGVTHDLADSLSGANGLVGIKTLGTSNKER